MRNVMAAMAVAMLVACTGETVDVSSEVDAAPSSCESSGDVVTKDVPPPWCSYPACAELACDYLTDPATGWTVAPAFVVGEERDILVECRHDCAGTEGDPHCHSGLLCERERLWTEGCPQ